MNWDDMRIVLALGRLETMSEAGAFLQLSHSTISRRVQALQESLGTRLFEYHGKAWHLTDVGRDVFDIAQRMEDQIMTIDRALVGQDDRLVGTVRLSTVDMLAISFGDLLRQFTRQFPHISLELSCTGRVVNLTKREADVVLRLQNKPDEHLVGYRLCRLEYAIYVAQSLLDELGLGEISPEHWSPQMIPWLVWDPAAGAKITEAWMRRNVPDAKITCALDHPSVMVDYVRQGMGAAAMPCGLFEGDPTMRRMTGRLPGFGVDMWLLTHEDLRQTARIKALMQFLRDALNVQKDTFERPDIPDEVRWL